VGNLKRGQTKSCGCITGELISKKLLKHGQARHGNGKLPSVYYRMWASAKNRCTNKKNPAYKWYGGRGITISPYFFNFTSFYDYVIKNLGEKPEGLTLDRINNNRGYEPGNIRWATRNQQTRNRRNSKNLEPIRVTPNTK
jgi:hypothetical protein